MRDRTEKTGRERVRKIETRHTLAVPPVQTEQTSEASGGEKPSETGRKRVALSPKPRQHFVYLSVHVSRPCWIDGSPLISVIDLSHVEDTSCLYAASLLVKPKPIQ
jgi:hypothetical protein